MASPTWEMLDGPPVNRPLRILLAVGIFLPILAGTVAYHDGEIQKDASDEVRPGGEYRLKGVVARTGADGEQDWFELRDEAGTSKVLWEHSKPVVGETYVVVAFGNETGPHLDGLAVVRAYFFK